MLSINVEGDVKNNQFYSNVRGKTGLPQEIIYSLLRVQGRKHVLKTENIKNDALTDSLRDKGFTIADQSRLGRSGSERKENYKSGELDLLILDSGGDILSIIEALELIHLDRKTIKKHIYKLLNRYDTAGNEENFVVVYSKSDRFEELWTKYKKFVDHKVFPVEEDIEELEMPKARIKGGRNYYLVNNKKLCLYHLFVDVSLGDSTN